MLSAGVAHRRQRALQLLQAALQSNRRHFSDRVAGTADFGYKEVPREHKVNLVAEVFSNVASSYDVMNDLMSGGMHRLWKDRFVATLGPFPGMQHLDVAGGTGDVAFRVLRAIRRAEAEEQQRTGVQRASALPPQAQMEVSSASSYDDLHQPFASTAGDSDTRRGGKAPFETNNGSVPPLDVELTLPGIHKSPTGGLSIEDFGSPSVPPSHPLPEEPAQPSSTQRGANDDWSGPLTDAEQQHRKQQHEQQQQQQRRERPAKSSDAKGGPKADPIVGTVTVLDINAQMLDAGRAKAAQQPDLSGDLGLNFVEGNAECLPFPDASFDSYTIAFGIRNVTDRDAALKEAKRVLKHGGRFMCLEFSRVRQPLLRELYDAYSFNVIPRIGGLVANDAESYQYLVESIRRFPDQDTFAGMIRSAGLRAVGYENIMDGAVAMHWGYKL